MLLAVLALVASWTAWTEFDPQGERDLRVQVQRQLDAWFGGRMTEPTPVMEERLAQLNADLGLPELNETISELWLQTGESIGDGAVPVSSLPLKQAPPPLIVPASHRGLIARMPFSDRTPPAIDPVIEYLSQWLSSSGRREADSNS